MSFVDSYRYRKLARSHQLPAADLFWTSYRARFFQECGHSRTDTCAAAGQVHGSRFREVEFAIVTSATFMCRVPTSYTADQVAAIAQGKAMSRLPLQVTPTAAEDPAGDSSSVTLVCMRHCYCICMPAAIHLTHDVAGFLPCSTSSVKRAFAPVQQCTWHIKGCALAHRAS